jgi:NAD(P)-dependent dehydrogenase (short-subunit alcohol dehydrogenase family)
MSKPLQGKVALVTGGTRGLGLATARSLADSGADVAITYIKSAGKAAKLVKELEDTGVQAAAFQNDQADTAQAAQLIDDIVARFGGLDIVINNAAISVEQGKTIDDPNIDVVALDLMHATNYTGVIAIIRAAAKVMRDNGRIVNIGSGIASRAGHPGFADYAATKAGIVGYTKGVARDLARRGITVNMVQAGLMLSGMEPPSPAALERMVASLSIQRLSEPAETAAVVTFLASPVASYVTGAVIDSNGGYTA